MNCERCREISPAFFQQTLAEPLRFETCEHLSECPDCRKDAEAAGHWEVEFLQLNDLAVPAEWMGRWQSADVPEMKGPERRHEETQKTPALRPAPVSRQAQNAWKFWLAGSLLFMMSAFLVFKYLPQKNESRMKTPAVSSLEPEAMRELNEIARRLGIRLDPSGKPVYVPGKVIAPEVTIKPLHAHLKFSSEEEVAAFEKWVFSLRPAESFKTPSLWILSLDRMQLYAVSERIRNRKIKFEGGFPAPTRAPIFEGTMRVSFYIDRTFQPMETLLLFQHWHFFFELNNRFDVLERLKAGGVRMLYETPELWVFEIQASQLEEVMSRVNEFNGIKKQFVNLDVLPDSGKVPIRISVYLEGR